jgi:hypothetical protein
MWHTQFERRLAAWNDLRNSLVDADLPTLLNSVNSWWHQSPWCPYHLHWDDQQTWPDPWQLLSDNMYCDLARSLGIMYTLVLTERSDLSDSSIIETDAGTIVQVNQGKYILNWGRDIVLNNSLEQEKITNVIDYHDIRSQLL